MTLEPDLASRLSRLALRTIQGEFYRTISEQVAQYALEDGPSYQFNNRYNIPEKFGALYFADNPEVCRATLEKRGFLASRTVPFTLLSFEISCNRILDLTDLKTLSHLSIHIEDFLKNSDLPGAYDLPQKFASSIYDQGAINGLFVPDVSRTGNTLVIYPSRVLANTIIRFKSLQSI